MSTLPIVTEITNSGIQSAQLRQSPPPYCQYADGKCDQRFDDQAALRGVILYASTPPHIAGTIEGAAREIQLREPNVHWRTWKEFQTTGQVIFCSICKNMRFAEYVVADVTTLNFNVLFEIGFALGLELPVIPVRDTTVIKDKTSFEREAGSLRHGWLP